MKYWFGLANGVEGEDYLITRCEPCDVVEEVYHWVKSLEYRDSVNVVQVNDGSTDKFVCSVTYFEDGERVYVVTANGNFACYVYKDGLLLLR